MAVDATTKVCTHCKTSKPLDQFGAHKQCRGGKNPQCKDCNRMRVKAYQDGKGTEYKARKRDYDRERREAGLVKCRRAWRVLNRDKLNAARAEWAKQNPEKVRLTKQNYKHKRRAIEAVGITTAQLTQWRNAQNKICHWCSADCEAAFHVDHYFPLSKGGRHEIDNLVISCPSCNLQKSDRDPVDFAKERKAFAA